jgi:predicted RNA binding protein YcfA (HicA-like mRNA interferase family)
MKIPADMSGEGLVMILGMQWSYRIVHQTGSHIVLETDEPSHQRLAVPAHPSLRIGTLNAILRIIASAKGKRREDLVKSL